MPRTRKRTTTRAEYSQADLEKAVSEVKQGGKIRDVASRYKMHASTLSRAIKRQINTGTLIKPKIGVSTLFSFEQERELVDYIKNSARMFHGISLEQAQKLAFSFAGNIGIQTPEPWTKNKGASRDWVYGFRRRHCDLSLRVPEATSLARVRGFNKEDVDLFFDNLEKIRDKHPFTPLQIWNLDETGCMTVQKPNRVLSAKGVKQLGQATSQERGSLVTVCCCVNAAGECLPPAYIFPRVHFQHHMLKGAPPGSLGLASKSGWMTTDLFGEVVVHFTKYMRSSKQSPAVLIMDNHSSHVSPVAMKAAKANGVYILTIPSHCSHRLQPLDLSVYGPFKAFYNRTMSSWMKDNPGQSVTIYEVAEISKRALLKAGTHENIQKGFEASGVYPLNRDIFTEDMFLPGAGDKPVGSPGTAGAESSPVAGPSGLPPLPVVCQPRGNPKRPKKSSTILTTLTSSSSSSSDEEPILNDSSSACSVASSEQTGDEQMRDIEEGDHLVVSIKGKRGSKHFVAEVTTADNDGGPLLVTFLKRSCKGGYFVKPDTEDESEVDLSEVVFRLPKAVNFGGSLRRKKMVSFGGAEKLFNVV